VGRPNQHRNGGGGRSLRIEAVAAIRCKIGDGGGAPVTGARQIARGWMGGLPGALKWWELARGQKTAMDAR
jgi:hypothetical protein